jgi:hypothetical protein
MELFVCGRGIRSEVCSQNFERSTKFCGHEKVAHAASCQSHLNTIVHNHLYQLGQLHNFLAV